MGNVSESSRAPRDVPPVQYGQIPKKIINKARVGSELPINNSAVDFLVLLINLLIEVNASSKTGLYTNNPTLKLKKIEKTARIKLIGEIVLKAKNIALSYP